VGVVLFLFIGSMWQIKMAIRQLLGACKCSVLYHSFADTLRYKIPPTVTKFGDRAFAVAGPGFLPADVQHITDTAVFKRHIRRTFLTCILIYSNLCVNAHIFLTM